MAVGTTERATTSNDQPERVGRRAAVARSDSALKKTVLVRWDYYAFPCWTWVDEDELGWGSTESLPLSVDLVAELWDWSQEMTRRAGEALGAPTQPGDYAEWIEHGRDLADGVAAELGPSWKVGYAPTAAHDVDWRHPSS